MYPIESNKGFWRLGSFYTGEHHLYTKDYEVRFHTNLLTPSPKYRPLRQGIFLFPTEYSPSPGNPFLPNIIDELPTVRLPGRLVDLLEDSTGALLRGDRRQGLERLDDLGVLPAVLEEVGLDGAGVDGEGD